MKDIKEKELKKKLEKISPYLELDRKGDFLVLSHRENLVIARFSSSRATSKNILRKAREYREYIEKGR